MKIGVSTNPERRLRGLQTAQHARLELFHQVPFSVSDAMLVERRSHARLVDREQSGEWFRVTPQEALDTIVAAAGALGAPILAEAPMPIRLGRRPSGRPRSEEAKVVYSIRIRPSDLEAFKARHPDWRAAIEAFICGDEPVAPTPKPAPALKVEKLVKVEPAKTAAVPYGYQRPAAGSLLEKTGKPKR